MTSPIPAWTGTITGDQTVNELKVTTLGVGKTPVSRQANIVAPAGGTTVDAEARAAIVSILAVLDAFGLTL